MGRLIHFRKNIVDLKCIEITFYKLTMVTKLVTQSSWFLLKDMPDNQLSLAYISRHYLQYIYSIDATHNRASPLQYKIALLHLLKTSLFLYWPNIYIIIVGILDFPQSSYFLYFIHFFFFLVFKFAKKCHIFM